MWRYILLIVVIVLLVGCAADTKPVLTNSCPAVRTWTKEQQLEILEEYKKLPAGSILRPVIIDYSRMRDSLKAITQ